MRIRRGGIRDIVVEAGRAAVYVDDQVVVLSEIATAILEAVAGDGGVELRDLTSALVDQFGPPPPSEDAEALIRQRVLDLIAHGILIDDDPVPASHPTPGSNQALRDALRHIRSSASFPWRLPAGVPADEFLASAQQHHVVPFLAHHSHRLRLPTGLESALSISNTQSTAAVEALTDALHGVLESLDRSGVRVLLFKGVALASQAHGHPAIRGAGDLDLLVAAEDIQAAHNALIQAGWVHDSTFPHPGPSWAWKHFIRTGYELTLVSEVGAIDLHWHLSPMRTTSPAFDELWQRREVLDIGNRPVSTLSRYDALAHSAAHSAKDQWRWLRSLLDVHVLASDPQTWHPDRPLRHDELVTLGLAARAFGVPENAPAVVYQSVRVAAPYWKRVVALHIITDRQHVPPETPGTSLMRSIHGLWHSRATVEELQRLLSRSLMPPWLTAEELSPHALVAVPRLAVSRATGMVGRLRDQRAVRRQ